VDFQPDAHAEDYRQKAREFIAANIDDEMLRRARETGTTHDWAFFRAIASTGFIADGMATEPGQTGRDPMELFVFFDELGLSGAPYIGLANTMLVAGVIGQIGSAFHKREVLPRLHAGDAIVALGYSEPGSGSDVAAAATRAERAPDGSGDWIINGQKMFTTFAHEAGYVILLTRTNPDVPKHRGLTMFLVPMDLPGIEVQAVWTMGHDRTNVTYYTDVRVSDDWRLGEIDGGWDVMKVALAYERGVFGNSNQGVKLLERFEEWARQSLRPDGSRVVDDPLVRGRMVRIAINNEITELLSLRTALIASRGGLPGIEGSLTKLFATTTYNQAAEWCLEMAAPDGLFRAGAPGAVAGGAFDEAARDAPITAIYGGTSEIQRNNIAERHLGLPRAR
jgi:alkylation response protein AidB-like acyl-CoA dehydrogenase